MLEYVTDLTKEWDEKGGFVTTYFQTLPTKRQIRKYTEGLVILTQDYDI